jgi:hypothetical protein
LAACGTRAAAGDAGPTFGRLFAHGAAAGVRAQHFSWWMTSMLHRFHDGTEFDLKHQLAELDLVISSRAAATTVAEKYVELPLS